MYVRSSHVVLTFRYSSDVNKSMCPPAPPTSMLRTSSSTDSLTNAAPIVVEYDGVDDGMVIPTESSLSRVFI